MVLFLVNVYICRELFGVEYLANVNTIEGAFIGMGRYAMAHWRDLTWFPLWNMGTPFAITYPPLLSLVTAFDARLFHLSPAHAYHATTALAYCLGPVALFALVTRLSGSRWTGFVAGLIYSSVSSSYWIIPSIGRDLGSPFFSRRLQALLQYGEGPHVTSMTLLTLALLCLDLAMTRRSAPRLALAALAFAATALTNWLGAFATALIVVPYTLAQFGRNGWGWRELVRVGWIGVAAYGLAMPLMPPSAIEMLQRNARDTGGDYSYVYNAGLPLALAVLAGLILAKALVNRLPRHLQFAILFAFLMTFVTVADGVWHVPVVPMALRYHLEMEMSLAMLAALALHEALRNRPPWIAGAGLALAAVALVWPLSMQRREAHRLLRTGDITQTSQWKTAQWLNQHWSGERVFLPGTVAQWLTAFSDTPELWGFAQAATNPVIRIALYIIYAGDPTGVHETDSAVLWLKALGIHAVGVSGPASTEGDRPFLKPKKFEGVLQPLWRDGDDVLYQVGADAALARVIPRAALVSRQPDNGLDMDPLRPYVAALDAPRMPRASFQWTNAHSAVISTNLNASQVVSVQFSWFKGWHAIVNGRPSAVKRDGIGFGYIDPHASGPCTIQLTYDGGPETLASHWLFAVTVLLLVGASVRSVVNRRVKPDSPNSQSE